MLDKIRLFFANIVDSIFSNKLMFMSAGKSKSSHDAAPVNNNITADQPIQYYLNDPTTPQLVKSVRPFTYDIKFQVKDYRGGGYSLNSTNGRAADVYVTICNALNMVKSYTTIFSSWAGTSTLSVLPDAGKDFNAFYDRRSLQFFHGVDPVDRTTIYTCSSSDIVTHELGHAVLDAFRPETWSAPALEIWSFHEGFADFHAILSIMQHEEVLNYMLTQTGGDLTRPNVTSNLAEAMGVAIYHLTKDPNRPRNCLRSAINDFRYVNPGTLPQDAPDNQLAAEPHSFGRIILGAFYDVLNSIYRSLLTDGFSQLQALIKARDLMGSYVFKTIKRAPMSVNFYESISKTLLWVAWNNDNGKYYDQIRTILLNRNLITRDVRILAAPQMDTNSDGIVSQGGLVCLKLSDHIIRAQGQDSNPLYDAEVQVPQESAFFYDMQTGQAIDFIKVTDEETLAGLQDAIIYLHEAKKIGESFEVKNGKLERIQFS